MGIIANGLKCMMADSYDDLRDPEKSREMQGDTERSRKVQGDAERCRYKHDGR